MTRPVAARIVSTDVEAGVAPGGTPEGDARSRRAAPDRRLLARRELPLGRPDLPARQPAPARAARAGARQAAPARPLGDDARPQLRLRPHEPRDPQLGPERDLRRSAPATAGPARSRTPTSRAPTRRSTRTIARDEEGLRELFRQFSFPGGIPSHVAPETPGSIHEGGELGYALSHAYGAAFDNPDLLVCCVVGDGEAETGPLATSWHSNKFLNPVTDGAVLPILHLNGYKIANPTVLARIGDDELTSLLEGYGHTRPLGRRQTSRRRCTSGWRRCSTRWSRRSPRSSAPRARTGEHGTAALADDRAADAEGLDGPEGGRRQADRGNVALASGAARRGADEPRAPGAARDVAEELPRPRSSSTTTAR